MIMQVKSKRVRSALEWVTGTLYKIGGSGGLLRFGGLLHGKLEALCGYRRYGRVCPKTTVDVVG